MKITNIDIKTIEVPLVEPFRISLGVITHAISAVIKVETDEGVFGYGEGAPGVLITGENLAGTVESIRQYAKALIGTDPRDLEKVYFIMDRTAPHAPCGKTAVDMACYDILGKSAGLPVYKLLGGYSGEIETDITVGIDTPQVMAEKAAKHVACGFNTIKTKVGLGLSADVERVKAIRKAVGDQVKIRIDANQAWSPKEAVNIIDRLNEYEIELVEQPVKAHDVDGLAYVTQNSKVLIMADEACFDAKDALKLIQKRAVDLVNIKLMKCGGIREALKINAICETAGVSCMLGCMVEETNLGVTAAASLGAAMKNITRADLDATFCLSRLPFKGGIGTECKKDLVLPEAPGFGFIGLEEN